MSLTLNSFASSAASFNDLQPLMLLNYQLVASFNRLLAGKDQNGSLLSAITNEQSKSLLMRLEADTEITRKLDMLAEAYQTTPKPKTSRKTVQKNQGPKEENTVSVRRFSKEEAF